MKAVLKLGILAMGIVLLALAGNAVAETGYVGHQTCFKCHPGEYNDFVVSGHSYKLSKAHDAKFRAIPLPEGYQWDDISYVIGGKFKKSRYIDNNGFIITAAKDGSELKTQFNIEDGTWSFYHKGEKKPYNCGRCHTTGYNKEGHQDGKEGLIGTWAEPGITCEACHGPAGDHIKSNELAKANPMAIREKMELCGGCHVRGAEDKIPASGGFIKHHEQFNESLRGPHNEGNDVTCITCHDQHKSAKFKEGIKVSCQSCHEDVGAAFAATTHGGFGVECIECHMPRASKSATKVGEFEGDVRTHIFRIATDADYKMFTDDGKYVAGDKVTLDFVCLHCHQNKDLKWAAEYAKKIH
jgi:hypothetical protein